MAIPAKNLCKKSTRLENPVEESNKARALNSFLASTGACDKKEAESILSGEEGCNTSEEEDNSTSEERISQPRRAPPAKKTPQKSTCSPTPFLSPTHVSMRINSPAAAAQVSDRPHPVFHPTQPGFWEQMDFNNNMQSTGCVMIRMIVHNGVLNSSDIEAEWQNSRLLKVRIRK